MAYVGGWSRLPAIAWATVSGRHRFSHATTVSGWRRLPARGGRRHCAALKSIWEWLPTIAASIA